MVFPEVFHEIVVKTLAQGGFYTVEIVHQGIFAESHHEPTLEHHRGIICKVCIAGHQRQNTVLINIPLLPVEGISSYFFSCRFRMGYVQTGLVKTIAAQHTAYGITYKLFRNYIILPIKVIFPGNS